MRGMEMPLERSVVTMARNSKTLTSKRFAMTWVLNISFSSPHTPPQNGVVKKEKQNLV
jgi:hypothetical protein